MKKKVHLTEAERLAKKCTKRKPCKLCREQEKEHC